MTTWGDGGPAEGGRGVDGVCLQCPFFFRHSQRLSGANPPTFVSLYSDGRLSRAEGSPQDSLEEPAVRGLPPSLPLPPTFFCLLYLSCLVGPFHAAPAAAIYSWRGFRTPGLVNAASWPPPRSLADSLPLLFPRHASTHQRMHAPACALRAVPRSNGV